MHNNLKKRFLQSTRIPPLPETPFNSDTELQKQLRDLFRSGDWYLFYRFFRMQIAVRALHQIYMESTGGRMAAWRRFHCGIEEAYLDSLYPDERRKQEAIIAAGGGPFYAGYREDVINFWPEAYMDTSRRQWDPNRQRYVYDYSY